jgi:hypothetical protein
MRPQRPGGVSHPDAYVVLVGGHSLTCKYTSKTQNPATIYVVKIATLVVNNRTTSMITGKFIQKYGVEEKFNFRWFWDTYNGSIYDSKAVPKLRDMYSILCPKERQFALDGKIDTSKWFRYWWDYPSGGGRIPHWHVYEEDYTWEDHYQGIGSMDELFWIELADWWTATGEDLEVGYDV